MFFFRIDEREKRRLYKFMLENMNEEDRFKTTYTICNDVRNAAVREHSLPQSAAVFAHGEKEGSVKLEGRSRFCHET